MADLKDRADVQVKQRIDVKKKRLASKKKKQDKMDTKSAEISFLHLKLANLQQASKLKKDAFEALWEDGPHCWCGQADDEDMIPCSRPTPSCPNHGLCHRYCALGDKELEEGAEWTCRFCILHEKEWAPARDSSDRDVLPSAVPSMVKALQF